MKLIAYMPTPGSLTGGPRRLLTLMRAFENTGLDVCLATECGSDLINVASDQGHRTVVVKLSHILSQQGGALLRSSKWFRSRVLFALLRQNLRFMQCIGRERSDVVWTRASKGIAFSGLAAILSRRPLIWDIAYDIPSRGAVRHLHYFGLWLATIVVFQYEAAPISIFGETLANRFRKKFRTAIPGIDLGRLKEHAAVRRQRYERAEGLFRILQVGTICERKNQEVIIDALRLLKSNGNPDNRRIVVRFAGGVFERDYALRLKAKAERHGLSDNIEFLGWRDDVQDLMVDADLLVMPSKNEGVPNTVQEAMFFGIPVIASGAGGMQEIVEHNITGWLAPYGDASRWSDAILNCMQFPELSAEIGQAAAQAAADRFGMDAWGAKYSALVKKAVGESSIRHVP